MKNGSSDNVLSEEDISIDETSPVLDVEIYPFSPTKFSRQCEKEELSNLNDRLASYIEKVRNLEIENNQLVRNIKIFEDNAAAEVSSVKSLYDKELSEARVLIDELSKEKVKVELDARRLFVDNVELKHGLEKKDEECVLFQTSLSEIERKLSEITCKYQQVLTENKRLNKENVLLKDDKNALSAELQDIKKQLEEEILLRVDKENALQTLHEDFEFKEQLFQQQLKESNRKKNTEMSEMEVLCQEYQIKLSQGLQEVRQQYELDLIHNKQEIKILFEDKVHCLEGQLNRCLKAAGTAAEEIKNLRCNIDVLNKKIICLEEERSLALADVRKLEDELEKEKFNILKIQNQNEEEISKLHKEMDERNKEYEDLMDIKIALDLEINAYRKLLEGEEERLKITPKCSPEILKVPQRRNAVKRKRLFSDNSGEMQISNFPSTTSTKCDISICQVCSKGRFIMLNNKGNEEMELGGWKLVNCSEKSSIIYIFDPSFKLSKGASVTVWSCNIPGVNHQPPENIVMKGYSWLIGDSTTILVNPLGKDMATYENKKQLCDEMYFKEINQSLINEKQPRNSEVLKNKDNCLLM